MKKIGIKLADGTFFPILEEGSMEKKEINLTTVKDNQTKVKVDLYRGEKSSIDEAEYLDTLEISKMKKHPNGEPNIGLEISLDEKNELSAKIVDKESGAESQVSLSLLSENKNSPKNFDAENSDEAEGVALAPSPQDEEKVSDDLPPLDDLDLDLPESFGDDAPAEESALTESLPQDDDFSLDENLSDAPQDEENVSDEIAQDLDLPDLDFPQEDFGETSVEGTAESNAAEDNPVEENSVAETAGIAEEKVSDNLPPLDDLDLPESFGDDAPAEESALAESLPQDDDFSLDENLSDAPQDEENVSDEIAQDSDLPDLDFPDISFDEPDSSAAQNEIQEETDSANGDLDFSDMDFDMPNFDDADFSLDGTNSNFDGEKKSSVENSFDSFSENNSSAGALDFSDLYDDENEYGENSQNKSQKFPVVVCVVCAIICVLALLAILFIAPTRFNSLEKNQSQNSSQELSQDFSSEKEISELPPPPEPVTPIAPPAKEDEVVVISETKNVVPDFPPPQEKKSAPKEIVYKIKWGDTLWDLAATYYKNPWLYPKIAHYNNIKNPDYIIAGTTIRIPEE